MLGGVDLTLFAHVVSRPEEDLDLAEAALLIAAAEHPELDIPRYLAMLDDLGAQARTRLAAAPPSASEPAVGRVLELLYGELGFRGNSEDYYDPRNSFLDDALDRRTGIPITLAVILIEVCRRAGLDARGVSYPGHFLVRVAGAAAGRAGTAFVDPFAGRLLEAADLRALLARAGGEEKDPDPALLAPAPKRVILIRMLNNLRGIYESRSDAARLRGVLERMQVLAPSEELRRELGALGGGRPWTSPGGHTLN